MEFVEDVCVALMIIWHIGFAVCSILLMAVVAAEVFMTPTCNTQKKKKRKKEEKNER